jgi:hypothetical protein
MLVGFVHEFRAVQTLLALALLQEKVVLTVAMKREFSATSAVDALLRAAVGLQFRHTDTKV